MVQSVSIVATFVLPPILARLTRGSIERDLWVRWTLGLCLVAMENAELCGKKLDGTFTFEKALPLQLCDWALYAAAIALLFRRQTAFDLAYFWGLGGTIQALVTPAVGPVSSLWRLTGFFAIHAGIVISVVYLILSRTFRPWPRSLLRVLVWSEIYLALTLAVDALTGGNYGFLSHRPSNRTMLDWLSDQHWLYVLELNLLALCIFAFLYAPWWIADWRRREPKPA